MDIKTIAIGGIIIYFFGGKIVDFVKGIVGSVTGAQGNDVGVYASSIPKARYYGSLNTSQRDFYNMWVARFGFAPSSASLLKSEQKKFTSFDKNLLNRVNKTFDKNLNHSLNNIIKNTRIKTSKPKTIRIGPFSTGRSPFSNSLDEFSNPIPFIGSDLSSDFGPDFGSDSDFGSGFDSSVDDQELTQAEGDAQDVGIDSFLSDRFRTGDHAQNRVTFL